MKTMLPDLPDQELIRSYASERSETAFQILVRRHLSLVFNTALRQVGDRSTAEEISQRDGTYGIGFNPMGSYYGGIARLEDKIPEHLLPFFAELQKPDASSQP